ncbi:MAG: phosphoribosylanthranilate isomerase [Candidatus Omnitrophota bacterium]
MANKVKVKICGITNESDALFACELGAWALGFVFHKKSPRYISPSKAKRIIEALPPFVTPVGVFANLREGAVRDIARFCSLRTLQFHGNETPQYCGRFRDHSVIKAFRVGNDFDISSLSQFKTSGYLFDTFQEDVQGGTGKTFNWDIIKDKKFTRPVILSGGLNPQNVAQAIGEIKPYAVDVSSGVEQTPGKKSGKLLIEFFQIVNSLN